MAGHTVWSVMFASELSKVNEDTVVISFTRSCYVWSIKENKMTTSRTVHILVNFLSIYLFIYSFFGGEHFSWFLKLNVKAKYNNIMSFIHLKEFIDWLFMQCWDNVYFCTELWALPPVYDRACHSVELLRQAWRLELLGSFMRTCLYIFVEFYSIFC